MILPSEYSGALLKPAIIPYLKIIQDCDISACIGVSNVDNGGGDVLNYVVKNYKTYNKKKNIQTNYFDDGQFILNDGSMVMIENPGRPLLALLPMGQEGTMFSSDEYCSLISTRPLNGIGCTYNAVTDENYWKNLP